MISIIPALELMRSFGGIYKSATGHAELRIWPCGYGVALDLRSDKKTELVGVIGAHNTGVECFAQIGLPNVIRLVGLKTSDVGIQFNADDFPLSIVFLREPGVVHVTITLHGQEKASYVLHAV